MAEMLLGVPDHATRIRLETHHGCSYRGPRSQHCPAAIQSIWSCCSTGPAAMVSPSSILRSIGRRPYPRPISWPSTPLLRAHQGCWCRSVGRARSGR